MIAQATCTQGAAAETEPENDTFSGTVWVCVWSSVCQHTVLPTSVNESERVRLRADYHRRKLVKDFCLQLAAANEMMHTEEQ